MKHWKIILGIFIGLTIFGLFLPFLITQKSWFSDLNLGRADANEIGDTIGGILGPYFSFIGSCLVAYTIYLQIDQRNEDKQKDFEKVIFENSLKSLESAEKKIHDLNALKPNEKFASIEYFNQYFKSNFNSETINVHLFMNEVNTALQLFNENEISNKAYQKIIIKNIDAILGLIRSNVLGKWNKVEEGYNSKNQSKIPISERRASDTKDIFEHTRPQQFTEVMSFYSNIKNLKTTFSEKFEPNFQQNELKQLNETCRWLHSLKEDIKDFWYSRQMETDLIVEELDQQLEPMKKTTIA